MEKCNEEGKDIGMEIKYYDLFIKQIRAPYSVY